MPGTELQAPHTQGIGVQLVLMSIESLSRQASNTANLELIKSLRVRHLTDS